MPRMGADALWALRRAMLNHGIDLMGAGGRMSSAHDEKDVERTVEAFSQALREMKEERIV